ncbi:MAG: 4-hydroxy-tetrahydrodipicolinate reductase, partial [Lysobacteraceae bacterium]
MAAPVRLLIHGANGRMGQALQRLCRDEDHGCEVVAAVSRAVVERVVDGIPRFAASELAGVPAFDVAIDFSLPAGFDAVLGLCVARGAPLVCGTTGLSAGQESALDAAAARIPLTWASNFSLGVAVLHELVERAARALP